MLVRSLMLEVVTAFGTWRQLKLFPWRLAGTSFKIHSSISARNASTVCPSYQYYDHFVDTWLNYISARERLPPWRSPRRTLMCILIKKLQAVNSDSCFYKPFKNTFEPCYNVGYSEVVLKSLSLILCVQQVVYAYSKCHMQVCCNGVLLCNIVATIPYRNISFFCWYNLWSVCVIFELLPRWIAYKGASVHSSCKVHLFSSTKFYIGHSWVADVVASVILNYTLVTWSL